MGENFPQPNQDEQVQHIDVQHAERVDDEPRHLDLQTDEWTHALAEAPIYKKFGKVHAQIA
ncbi:hypothetical protein KC952_04495, partial [Candidatus Saccharibacteria bacterium]|nr:hypothetical protein [Candidatus Saccharibacteria bacterium]